MISEYTAEASQLFVLVLVLTFLSSKPSWTLVSQRVWLAAQGALLFIKVLKKHQPTNSSIWSAVFLILYQTHVEELSLDRDNVTHTCKVNDFGRFTSHQCPRNLEDALR